MQWRGELTSGEPWPDGDVFAQNALLIRLAQVCRRHGGRAVIVGGAIRDHMLHRPVRDVDVEVHGLQGRLGRILKEVGVAKEVGRAFGVFKLRADGASSIRELDVSQPDEDAEGDLQKAVLRRDLTINALIFDPLEQLLFDGVGGVADIRAGLLRAVDGQTFVEDPLRVLRVARFQATLGFRPTDELLSLCGTVALDTVAAERLGEEMSRILVAPDMGAVQGLQMLFECGAAGKCGLDQGAFGTLLPALQRAALGRAEAGPQPRGLARMWSTLLHRHASGDLEVTLDRFAIHSRGGYPLRKIVSFVVQRLPEVMGDVSDESWARLAEKGEAGLLALTAWAVSGTDGAKKALGRLHSRGIAFGPLPALLMGRDLIAYGIGPGVQMGRVLDEVREAQLQGKIQTVQQAEEFVRLMNPGTDKTD